MSTVEITEHEGGGFSVLETETGTFGEGETLADALEQLAERLRNVETVDGTGDPEARFADVAEAVRERFETEGVSEGDLEDAIEWARSE